MNNRELIERIEKLDRLNGDRFNIEKIKIISLIEQLEEPPKAIIPQPVADWIEFCKTNNMSLRSAYYPFHNFPENSSNVYEWDLITCIKWVRSNWNLFVRAWKNGYDIEKEKRYLVKMKNLRALFCYLAYISDEGYWTYMASGGKKYCYKTHPQRARRSWVWGSV